MRWISPQERSRGPGEAQPDSLLVQAGPQLVPLTPPVVLGDLGQLWAKVRLGLLCLWVGRSAGGLSEWRSRPLRGVAVSPLQRSRNATPPHLCSPSQRQIWASLLRNQTRTHSFLSPSLEGASFSPSVGPSQTSVLSLIS